MHRNPWGRSLLTVVSATSASLFQLIRHEQNVCNQGDFLADQTDESHYGPSLGSKVDVQEVPTVILEFCPELLDIVMMKQSCQLAWMFSASCIQKLQQNLTV
jgi:hypothetical protein